jgi:tetratricopeptide (TPR) repeat protein
MATVYLVRDVLHDRPVALKVLLPELGAAVGAERFLREIRLAARLQHPNILPVLDSGESAGQIWYAIPFIEEGSLRQRLAREPQLPLGEAVRIATQVASALAFAHGRGVVHRDVKPENILLAGDQCVLADFGIASALDAAGTERLTGTGHSLGTPGYMSPEQATADRNLDGRSDIYSLGCVVYEMLAGEPPFTGRTAQAILARSLSEPVPQLRTIRDVPEQVEQVITRALARSAADRFADAGQFARALTGAAAVETVIRRVPAPVSGRRRRGALLGGIALLCAAALAVAAYLRLRPAEAVTLDPNLLAIAPFDVLEPSLELWREGLGDILSRSLDGAGPLRTVSPSVTLGRWEGRADRASAEQLARRTGAGLVVFGAVVPQGRDSVTLRAAVLDGTGASALTDIEVSGETARIGEVADSLGIGILRSLARSRPIGSVRRVSLGSSSLPALKAFLQGEQFYRRGRWDSALAWYDQAVSADSGFALPYRRMAFVLGWNPPTAGAYLPHHEYIRRAALLNHGLSPKDSLLIAADSLWLASGDAPSARDRVAFSYRALAVNEDAVRRYPDDPEVWYVLAEVRHHEPAPIRVAPDVSLAMFERIVTLDPGFAPAYEHLPDLAMISGRPELARRYAAEYVRLDPTSEHAAGARFLIAMLDSGASGRAEAARMLDTASVQTIFNAGLFTLSFWLDSGETTVRATRRMADSNRSATGGSAPWMVDSVMWPQYLAMALASRGHLRAAYRTDSLLLHDASASQFSWFADPFLNLSLLGIIPDSVASATFARSLAQDAGWGGPFTMPRYLRGLPWWLSRRDTSALARFAARARNTTPQPGSPWIEMRARLLGGMAEAFYSLARGDSTEALRRMEAIPDTLCLVDDYAPNCFYLRVTQSRVLAARGELRRAADLLEYWRWDDVGAGPAFVLAMLERGRIAEQLGETEKALESYRFVMVIWRRADVELEPFVSEAREGVRRLSGD